MNPYIELGFLGVKLPAYGLCAVLGMAAAVGILEVSRRKHGIKRSDAIYFMCYAMIGAFIGAKLLYLIVEFPRVISDPGFLLAAIAGGMVFYGGVIGGAVAGIIYVRHYKLSVLEFFDMAAPALALGQAIGRVGCHFAGCCYGMEYDGPLSVVYPPGSPAPAGVPLLATQLMEAAFLALLTGTLLLILRGSKKVGSVAGWYFILYSSWRFAIEFFRNDPRGAVGALSTSQFISIFLFVIGVYLLLRRPPRKQVLEHQTAGGEGAGGGGEEKDAETVGNEKALHVEVMGGRTQE